jgi:hypothetical protein
MVDADPGPHPIALLGKRFAVFALLTVAVMPLTMGLPVGDMGDLYLDFVFECCVMFLLAAATEALASRSLWFGRPNLGVALAVFVALDLALVLGLILGQFRYIEALAKTQSLEAGLAAAGEVFGRVHTVDLPRGLLNRGMEASVFAWDAFVRRRGIGGWRGPALVLAAALAFVVAAQVLFLGFESEYANYFLVNVKYVAGIALALESATAVARWLEGRRATS